MNNFYYNGYFELKKTLENECYKIISSLDSNTSGNSKSIKDAISQKYKKRISDLKYSLF
jgi:hypothetical protein